jgi:hypothetical protein
LGEYQNLWRKERADKMWRSEVEEEKKKRRSRESAGRKEKKARDLYEGRRKEGILFPLFTFSLRNIVDFHLEWHPAPKTNQIRSPAFHDPRSTP